VALIEVDMAAAEADAAGEDSEAPRASPPSAVALLRTPSAIAYGVGRGRARGATCSAEVAASATKVESW
jgi:hypothetical protein